MASDNRVTATWKTAVLAGQVVGWLGMATELVGETLGHKNLLFLLFVAPTFFATGVYWVGGLPLDRSRFRKDWSVVIPAWGRMFVWFLSAATTIVAYTILKNP